MTDTFLLVDGYSLAFRAYYGMPDSLRDPRGEPVHVVYGFFSVLFSQIPALGARYLAVAWDIGRPRREDEERDDELGHVAERHVHETADLGAGANREMLRRAADPLREGDDGQDPDDEDPHR